jgi:hypothetical protein
MHLSFQIIYPQNGKCVMVDDTCNYISCNIESEVELLYSLLTSYEAEEYFKSIIFWDSKRPITTEVLNSINIKKVACEHNFDVHYNALMEYNNSIRMVPNEYELFA